MQNIKPVLSEIHIRQLTVDEALIKLEKYLDDAFMSGLHRIRIIHGKGTGTLRKTVQERLSNHPLVSSYRTGVYGEGGVGVTIVELASRYRNSSCSENKE